MAEEEQQPFDEVGDVEKEEEQFSLLSRVNALVVDHLAIDPRCVARPKRAEKVDAVVLWHDTAADDDGVARKETPAFFPTIDASYFCILHF